MSREKILNVPNALSFYRLLFFPFLLYLSWVKNEELFAIFFSISLVTDILDGLLARLLKQQTNFGARLDSLADLGLFITAFLGVLVFKMNILGKDIILLWIFLALFIFVYVFSFLKFRNWPSFHLYSMKISGYLQGTFFFVLFVVDYYPVFFFVSVGFGLLAWIEELIFLIILKELKSNLKGLFWYKKNGENP